MGTTTVQIGGVNITANPDGSLTTSKQKGIINAGTQRELLSEVALAHKYKIKCHGLKPLTAHFFTFGGVDFTAFCRQSSGGGPREVGKKLGAGLSSGPNGILKFEYHHHKVIDVLDVTDLIQWEQAKAFATSAKVAMVSSADGASTASFTMDSNVKKGLEKWFDTWVNVGG